MSNIYVQRIEALRSIMRSRGYDAVIIGGSDPHQSEYPALRWKQVEWLTGFTGEAGDVVVTEDHAGLWTDTRYFIQAVKQLEGTSVVLHKTRVPEQVLIPEWLQLNFSGDAVICLDSLCQSSKCVASLKENFTVAGVPDLLSYIWTDRPPVPQTPIFRISAGESCADKIEWLRSRIAEKGCAAMLVSALDEVAWLLNVRASDIEYNPLVISYLIVGQDYIKWYVLKDEDYDPQSEALLDTLNQEAGVEILPYSRVSMDLKELEDTIMVDPYTMNSELRNSLGCPAVECDSPIALRKACKNSFEVEGMRQAHIKDGIAMERFLYWLEKSTGAGKTVTEWDAAVQLGRFRAMADDYIGDSFETISAFGAGAALPHYITPKENAPAIGPDGLYLCDSGGHYLCGTTDITRTVPIGECTPLEVRDYTLVLKGHIDLALAQFPQGTPGCRIDALAREPLWEFGLNFGHGTGHGVGFVLGVHEGPQDIRQNLNDIPLMENMIISDEPGIYREGMFGVRHENLILCTEGAHTEFGDFLRFEPLTLCHFDTSIVDVSLLGDREISWLNDYNRHVYETLSPLLEENVAGWLKSKCSAL